MVGSIGWVSWVKVALPQVNNEMGQWLKTYSALTMSMEAFGCNAKPESSLAHMSRVIACFLDVIYCYTHKTCPPPPTEKAASFAFHRADP